MPESSKWSLSLRFSHQTSVHISPLPLTCYMPCPSHSFWFYYYIFLGILFSNILSLHSSLSVNDQVSHPYKTTEKIIVLYILIFIFLGSKLETKRFCTKWYQAFPDLNLLLISSWIEFWFVQFVPPFHAMLWKSRTCRFIAYRYWKSTSTRFWPRIISHNCVILHVHFLEQL